MSCINDRGVLIDLRYILSSCSQSRAGLPYRESFQVIHGTEQACLTVNPFKLFTRKAGLPYLEPFQVIHGTGQNWLTLYPFKLSTEQGRMTSRPTTTVLLGMGSRNRGRDESSDTWKGKHGNWISQNTCWHWRKSYWIFVKLKHNESTSLIYLYTVYK